MRKILLFLTALLLLPSQAHAVNYYFDTTASANLHYQLSYPDRRICFGSTSTGYFGDEYTRSSCSNSFDIYKDAYIVYNDISQVPANRDVYTMAEGDTEPTIIRGSTPDISTCSNTDINIRLGKNAPIPSEINIDGCIYSVNPDEVTVCTLDGQYKDCNSIPVSPDRTEPRLPECNNETPCTSSDEQDETDAQAQNDAVEELFNDPEYAPSNFPEQYNIGDDGSLYFEYDDQFGCHHKVNVTKDGTLSQTGTNSCQDSEGNLKTPENTDHPDYCTFHGSFCTDGQPNTGGGDTGGGDTGGGDTGGGDTGGGSTGGGDTGGGSTGGGDTGGGDTGGGSTGGGDTGGGSTGGGDTGGGSTGGGDTGGGDSGDGNGSGDGDGDGDAPPFTGTDKDLYESTDLTYESVLSDFASRITGSQLGGSVTNFFTVSISATCPVWTIPSVLNMGEILVDMQCSQAMENVWPIVAGVLFIVGGFISWRIAVGD